MKISKKNFYRIMRKYREVFADLENYDKTHELPFHRKRIDITLSARTINKLREESRRTGKPVSHVRKVNCTLQCADSCEQLSFSEHPENPKQTAPVRIVRF
ncbi:MAG: hypothetical protein KKB21_00835 [Nanoarchaeota archaeon]|nr:hypothetical protein [Nanoarchaeota archaeon]